VSCGHHSNISIEVFRNCVQVVIDSGSGTLFTCISGRHNALFLRFIFFRWFRGCLLNRLHPGRFRKCLCLRVVGAVNSGIPRSISIEVFRKCAPVVSAAHGDLLWFFRLRCGGVLCPGCVGDGCFRCVVTPEGSGGGRGVLCVIISSRHYVLLWFIFSRWFRTGLLHWLNLCRFRR